MCIRDQGQLRRHRSGARSVGLDVVGDVRRDQDVSTAGERDDGLLDADGSRLRDEDAHRARSGERERLRTAGEMGGADDDEHAGDRPGRPPWTLWTRWTRWTRHCLLYTSDAADDLTRVDLGGRRI